MSRVNRPHYFDPITSIRFDTDCAEFEGWLTKQSAWVKVCITMIYLLKFMFTLFC